MRPFSYYLETLTMENKDDMKVLDIMIREGSNKFGFNAVTPMDSDVDIMDAIIKAVNPKKQLRDMDTITVGKKELTDRLKGLLEKVQNSSAVRYGIEFHRHTIEAHNILPPKKSEWQTVTLTMQLRDPRPKYEKVEIKLSAIPKGNTEEILQKVEDILMAYDMGYDVGIVEKDK
jgi:hypothetical protein